MFRKQTENKMEDIKNDSSMIRHENTAFPMLTDPNRPLFTTSKCQKFSNVDFISFFPCSLVLLKISFFLSFPSSLFFWQRDGASQFL